MATTHDKFMKLVTGKSNLLEYLEFEHKNRAWLNISQKIALRILEELDNRKMTRVEFCLKTGFSQAYLSKLVKGGENLTIESITKIEYALQIKLIKVVGFERTKKQLLNPKKITRPIK